MKTFGSGSTHILGTTYEPLVGFSIIHYRSGKLTIKGFTYDYIGPSNIETTDTVIRDGTLAPDGPSYRAVILCNQKFMSPAASAKLLSYATQGLPIFIVGDILNTTIGTDGQGKVFSNMRALVEAHPNVHLLKYGTSLVSDLQTAGVRPRASSLDETGSGRLYKSWRSDENSKVELAYLCNKGSGASFEFAFETAQGAIPFFLDTWNG